MKLAYISRQKSINFYTFYQMLLRVFCEELQPSLCWSLFENTMECHFQIQENAIKFNKVDKQKVEHPEKSKFVDWFCFLISSKEEVDKLLNTLEWPINRKKIR